MLVGTDEHEIARIKLPRLGASTSRTASGTPRRAAASTTPETRHGRIETDEGVVRAKRIVERAAMLEPKVRRPASGNRRGREMYPSCKRLRLAIVSDDRRVVVEIAEIEAAAALVLDIEVVSLLADAGAHGLTDGPGHSISAGISRRCSMTFRAMSMAKRDTCSVIGWRSAS